MKNDSTRSLFIENDCTIMMKQVLHRPYDTRLYIPKEEIHVGWHLCPFHRTHAHKQSWVKTFPNVPIYSLSWGYPCGMTFLSLLLNTTHAQKWILVKTIQNVVHLPCGMTLLSLFEHHACAEMNFGKNDPKRCPLTPRVKGSHVGWHFCPWFDTAHAQKQKTRFLWQKE